MNFSYNFLKIKISYEVVCKNEHINSLLDLNLKTVNLGSM